MIDVSKKTTFPCSSEQQYFTTNPQESNQNSGIEDTLLENIKPPIFKKHKSSEYVENELYSEKSENKERIKKVLAAHFNTSFENESYSSSRTKLNLKESQNEHVFGNRNNLKESGHSLFAKPKNRPPSQKSKKNPLIHPSLEYNRNSRSLIFVKPQKPSLAAAKDPTSDEQGVLSIIRNIFEKNKMLGNLSPRTLQTLKETFSNFLPFPGYDPKRKDVLILWRGLKPVQLVGMIANGSAAGVEPAESETEPPSEKEAIDQVAEIAKLPEFTSNSLVANSFGRGNIIGAFRIKKKYLAKGSNTESGYVCKEKAPVELLAWQVGNRFE